MKETFTPTEKSSSQEDMESPVLVGQMVELEYGEQPSKWIVTDIGVESGLATLRKLDQDGAYTSVYSQRRADTLQALQSVGIAHEGSDIVNSQDGYQGPADDSTEITSETLETAGTAEFDDTQGERVPVRKRKLGMGAIGRLVAARRDKKAAILEQYNNDIPGYGPAPESERRIDQVPSIFTRAAINTRVGHRWSAAKKAVSRNNKS